MSPSSRARRTVVVAIASLLAVAVVVFFAVVPRYVDGSMNGVVHSGAPAVADSVNAFHDSLFVADLHADQLLWSRDLLQQSARGHVDLPRLADANVALQLFSVVTKTPRGLNFDRNTGETDNITLLAFAQRWPPRTWTSLTARAQHQAARLHDAAARSNGRLTVLRTREDLARFVERRRANPHRVAGVLTLEGMQAIEGKLDRIDTLYAAGFRILGLAHFFDNEVAASAHGLTHGGLTPLGREAIQRMEALGMTVDLAHTSPQAIEEALAIVTRPVLVSHTGVTATCPGPRNLTDDQLRAVAAKGGLVGIGFFEGAVCGLDAAHIVRAIVHAVGVMGVQHVALGSDFDGAVRTPWDTRGVREITAGLLAAGMSRADIRAVMGGNAQGFLLQALPAASP